MTCHACLFEAKSIQDYILRSGRLRHIVGASELIDFLAEDLLDDVLAALRLTEGRDIRFSRRAGGAVYLFSSRREASDAFRDLWTLVVRQYAPGLEFVIAQGKGATDHAAYQQALEGLQAARNRRPPTLPSGGPVTRYAPRTGQPAVSSDAKLGLQDAATARFSLDRFWRRGGLTAKFADKGSVPIDDWPRSLEHNPNDGDGTDFPFWPDNRYLGLIHADGNGLGQLLIHLDEQVRSCPDVFVGLFRDFSTAITEATRAAAQDATRQVLLPARGNPNETKAAGAVPARPIVLGGDDLTILVRADLAISFTRVFLTAFEHRSREKIKPLRDRYPTITGLPEALTAGAGIAFVKSNHPFHLAHELAESLASFAKDRAKEQKDQNGRIPPTLAFHRVTTASHADYEDIRQREMTHGPDNARIITTLGAYRVDPPPPGLPALTDLEVLAYLLSREEMARGPARQVLTLLGQNSDDARRRYARWREVMGDRHPERFKEFNDLLASLCGGLDDGLPISQTGATPLGDVVTLLAVSTGTSRELPRTEDTP